jgi:DNA-binding NarL/FixJ family response regulator
MHGKILLADDHSMILKTMRMTLELNFGNPVAATAATCEELLAELRAGDYTHLVLDINLRDGSSLPLIPEIRRQYPSLKIMVLSMHPSAIYADVLKRRYAIDDYLSKSAPENETMAAIRRFFTNAPVPAAPEIVDPFARLSPRERDVLRQILDKKATGEIADALKLRNNTISTLKKRILEKTRTANTLDLQVLAGLYGVTIS